VAATRPHLHNNGTYALLASALPAIERICQCSFTENGIGQSASVRGAMQRRSATERQRDELLASPKPALRSHREADAFAPMRCAICVGDGRNANASLVNAGRSTFSRRGRTGDTFASAYATVSNAINQTAIASGYATVALTNTGRSAKWRTPPRTARVAAPSPRPTSTAGNYQIATAAALQPVDAGVIALTRTPCRRTNATAHAFAEYIDEQDVTATGNAVA